MANESLATGVVRPAKPTELRRLPEIHRASRELFRRTDHTDVFGLPELVASDIQAAIDDNRCAVRVLLVDDVVVGFALYEIGDGYGHLHQLSVRPEFSRRGLGSLLLGDVIDDLARRGQRMATLVTYRDIPWNAPFYERRGFLTLERDAPAHVEAHLEEESAAGMDMSRRVAMALHLS